MQEKDQDILLAEMSIDIKYIKEFIHNADSRYASKLSEKLVYGLVGIALIALASALLAGVIKAAEIIFLN
jgi:hypothetical protein